MCYRRAVLLIAIYVVILSCVDGFNLSPQPNYEFKEPTARKSRSQFVPKVRSSYFGYSINLRVNGVMVGAPRAQSSLESQRNINESGAIYKCSFNSANCKPFIIDNKRDTYSENNTYELNTEIKSHQWLGASMDGNFLDDDLFVVCAPRIMSTWDRDDESEYSMHGLCYLTSNTRIPLKVQKLAPFRKTDKQFLGGKYIYMLSEEGISVHITENGEEILIGAPGVYEWRGTVIRYRTKPNRNAQQNLQIQNDFYIDVPFPGHWHQDEHSYFGYAITSGYFHGSHMKNISYVASAPQTDLQQGEVYIFDIVSEMESIKKYTTFNSRQFGEYFGYALAADDFDGDGFYDLAICAPFYSNKDSYENGAVYIHKNLGESTVRGKGSLNFVLQNVLLSDYESGGRFGSSISRLGDINQDGYKDIAIGAPYEDNGAVYIYLGSPNGIIIKPSQRLTAPYNANVAPFTPQMFGHALSKAVDIDGNKYLDLAIGAPDAERVYVYRSYPVVRIHGNVYPHNKSLKTDEKSLKFKVCWSIKSSRLNESRINIIIKVDEKFNRLKFPDKTNQLPMSSIAKSTRQCKDYTTTVKFEPAHVYKSMDIEMHYNVVDKVPNSTAFCSNCVAVNPSDSKVARSKVVFNTGCGKAKCVADLKLSRAVLCETPYKIGSTRNITIAYKIENSGETAYLAQINVTISELVIFMKVPSNCHLYNIQQLLCNVNNGIPLNRGELGFLNVSLDTTNLHGEELLIKANVNSKGDERNDDDNHANVVIPLTEFSKAEMSGKSSKPLLILEDGSESENVSYTYEIRNSGPTYLKQIDVVLSIPITYQNDLTMFRFDVISIENISVKGTYNYQQFGIEWLVGRDAELQNVIDNRDEESPIRADADEARNASEYGENVELYIDYTTPIPDDKINERNDSGNFEDNLKGLKADRTILFDCFNSTTKQCVQAKFSVNNFQVGITPILIELKFSVNLRAIDQIFGKSTDWFVIRPSIELVRKDNEDGKKMQVDVESYAYTIIWKQGTIPLWAYILAALAGLLTLMLLVHGLFRLGFFRRAKKEELQVLVRQSLMQAQLTLAEDYEDN